MGRVIFLVSQLWTDRQTDRQRRETNAHSKHREQVDVKLAVMSESRSNSGCVSAEMWQGNVDDLG